MWPWWVRIPIEDFTDVTLASEDADDFEEDEDDDKVKKWVTSCNVDIYLDSPDCKGVWEWKVWPTNQPNWGLV